MTSIRIVQYEFPCCLHCQARYLEDCEEKIKDGDKYVLPEGCWRKDYIKLTPKPNNHAV